MTNSTRISLVGGNHIVNRTLLFPGITLECTLETRCRDSVNSLRDRMIDYYKQLCAISGYVVSLTVKKSYLLLREV